MKPIDDDSVRRMLDETGKSIMAEKRRVLKRNRNSFLRYLEEIGFMSREALENFSPEQQEQYRHLIWGCSMGLLASQPSVIRCLDLGSYDDNADKQVEEKLFSAVMKFLQDEHSKWVTRNRAVAASKSKRRRRK